jgi:hypothetical protein
MTSNDRHDGTQAVVLTITPRTSPLDSDVDEKLWRSAIAERITSANVFHRRHVNDCLDVANYPAAQAFLESA